MADVLLKEEDLQKFSTAKIVVKGISFGMMLAVAISWHEHQDIFWAIVQGLCGWLYVGYWYFIHEAKESLPWWLPF